MLDGLRIMSKNLFGRAILAAFAGLIVVGFGFFGIRDVFTNFRGNQLATVGDAEIGVMQYRNEYQNELQRLQGRAHRAITNDEARALGLDRQVLSRLMTGSALDQAARQLGLAVSDEDIAKKIRADKTFANSAGVFDQPRFLELLRENGYTEASFLREQKRDAVRQQLASAVTGGFRLPNVTIAALNSYANETRKADYFVLSAPDPASEAAPSDEDIKTMYDIRKDSWRSPETRAVTTLIQPAGADTPEKRALKQLTFSSREAADKALERLKAGQAFSAVAADKSAGGVLADLGETTKAAIFDPAIADAAFAPPAPGVSAVAQGKFGFVLVDVEKITPGAKSPLPSRADVQKLHEKIEDLRASGKPLAEAAAAVGLKTETFVTDASGRGKGENGQPGAPIPALTASPELLAAIFKSDVGVDNDSVPRKDGGYSWFEINSIEPSRQLPLEEVKPAVIATLRESAAQRDVAAKANEFVKKLDAGASLADIAAAAGAKPQQAEGVRRAGAPGLTPSAAAQIFGTPVGGAGVALADKGGRIVFKVTDAQTPPLNVKNPEIATLLPQVQSATSDDLLEQYVAGLETQLGVRINQTALHAAVAGSADQ